MYIVHPVAGSVHTVLCLDSLPCQLKRELLHSSDAYLKLP